MSMLFIIMAESNIFVMQPAQHRRAARCILNINRAHAFFRVICMVNRININIQRGGICLSDISISKELKTELNQLLMLWWVNVGF